MFFCATISRSDGPSARAGDGRDPARAAGMPAPEAAAHDTSAAATAAQRSQARERLLASPSRVIKAPATVTHGNRAIPANYQIVMQQQSPWYRPAAGNMSAA
jgi:hypothetical protein